MGALLLVGFPLLILVVFYVEIVIPLRSINKQLKQVIEELKIIQSQPIQKWGK